MVRSIALRHQFDLLLNQPFPKLGTLFGKLLLVVLFALVGYSFAPRDLQPGEYVVSISVMQENSTYTVQHAFQLGAEDGDKTTSSIQVGPYQVIVEGRSAFANQLGQQITYRILMIDAEGRTVPIPLHAVKSQIRGEDYEQMLPATSTDGEWYSFAMRVPYKAKFTLGLLFAIAILWITELVPLAATALLIPVIAVLAGIADATTVLAPFSNPIIALFMAGFLLADTMRRTGVDRRIALLILNRASHNPIYLMLTLMAITSFLCLWMSNTASASLMVPIALAILAKIPPENMPKGYPRALVLAVAYAATVGGVGSAIGTPPNILAMSFLNQYTGGELTFLNWFAYGLPFVVIMLPII